MTFPDFLCSCMALISNREPSDVFGTPARRVDNIPEGWEERNDDENNALFFWALTGYVATMKVLGEDHVYFESLHKRWSTFCSQIGLAPTQPINTADLRTKVSEFSKYMSNKQLLRKAWARTILDNNTDILGELKEQIILVWEHLDMRSVVLMDNFCHQATLALLEPHVHEQAVSYLQAYNRLKKKYGDAFKYARVLDLDITELQHRNYPDLYFCAVMMGRKTGAVTKNFQYSKNLPTVAPKNILKMLVSHGTDAQLPIPESAADAAEKFLLLGLRVPRSELRRMLEVQRPLLAIRDREEDMDEVDRPRRGRGRSPSL